MPSFSSISIAHGTRESGRLTLRSCVLSETVRITSLAQARGVIYVKHVTHVDPLGLAVEEIQQTRLVLLQTTSQQPVSNTETSSFAPPPTQPDFDSLYSAADRFLRRFEKLLGTTRQTDSNNRGK